MNTFYIRASSFGSLMDCPARWKAIHLDGLRSPNSVAAHLGTSIHASTAAFDQATIDGLNIKPHEAAGVFIDTLHHPKEDVDWSDSDMSIRQAEDIGLTLHTRYCQQIAPTQQFIAVEETMPDLAVDFAAHDVRILLTGHIDRIRRTEYGIGIGDLKSGVGANAVDKNGVVDMSPHLTQLGVYELLTEQAIEQTLTAPAAIYGMSTGKNLNVGIGLAQEPPKNLLLGDADTPGLLEMTAKMFAHDLWYGNPRSQLCSKRYCPAWAKCRWKGGA
jgi:hypothetical protein